MELFDKIYRRAAKRKGGELALQNLLSKPLLLDSFAKIPNNLVLAAFSKKVFQSGFVWSVVEKKWPQFEEVFWNFDIEKLILMPDDMLERKAADPKIIRNFNKVKTIRDNAIFFKELSDEFGSVAQWISDWPNDDIIGLWAYLKKQGNRLGGNTGPYALRTLGRDTFLLSRDVEAYFRAHKLIEGGLTSKRSLATIQSTFNQWQQESHLSLQELSQVLAFSTGDNYLKANES